MAQPRGNRRRPHEVPAYVQDAPQALRCKAGAVDEAPKADSNKNTLSAAWESLAGKALQEKYVLGSLTEFPSDCSLKLLADAKAH